MQTLPENRNSRPSQEEEATTKMAMQSPHKNLAMQSPNFEPTVSLAPAAKWLEPKWLDFLEDMVKKTDIPVPHLIEVIQCLRDFAADEEDGSFKIACILKLSLNVKWAVTKARTN